MTAAKGEVRVKIAYFKLRVQSLPLPHRLPSNG